MIKITMHSDWRIQFLMTPRLVSSVSFAFIRFVAGRVMLSQSSIVFRHPASGTFISSDDITTSSRLRVLYA
jgi:valyl-tRNA synthetase